MTLRERLKAGLKEPTTGIIKKVYGATARFCRDSCFEGFKCDREHCLIYSSYRLEELPELVGVEHASIICNFCAYCTADLEPEDSICEYENLPGCHC